MKKAELQEIVPELLKFFNDYIYHQFEISADGIPANADEYRITPEHIRLLADSGEKEQLALQNSDWSLLNIPGQQEARRFPHRTKRTF